MSRHRELIAGAVINGFKVLSYRPKRIGNNIAVLARCPKCKRNRVRLLSNLYKVKSCGCDNTRNFRHGGASWPEYKVWTSMKQRCMNPKEASYSQYGGRGITVCTRWLVFKNFIADLGRRPTDNHTLERKDVNKGYNPDNVIWAPRPAQGLNRTNNRFITWRGETRTLSEWARYISITQSGLRQRLKRMSVEKAMTMPFSGIGRRVRAVRFVPTNSVWSFVMSALREAQMCGADRKAGECPVCAGRDGIHLPYCKVGRALERYSYRRLLKRGLRSVAGAYGG